jgi:hypothetical protein
VCDDCCTKSAKFHLAVQMQQMQSNGKSTNADVTTLQERGETQWMYINILFENSELQVRTSRLVH